MTSWICPSCRQPTTLTSPNISSGFYKIDIDDEKLTYEDQIGIGYTAYACPNTDCKELFLKVDLREAIESGYGIMGGSVHQSWQLLPESTAKLQPDYIPKQIIEDYTEACRIRELSPKASATLSRRCLQGMIRNFWDIKVASGKLYDEINLLEDKISSSEWGAIDAVRSVGNIGAHMEKDVDIIVDVSSDEADLLIQLIEDLFDTWYVARHDRDERQKKLKALAESKKVAKKQNGDSA